MRLTILLPAVLIGLTAAAATPATPVQDPELQPNRVRDAQAPAPSVKDCCPPGGKKTVSCPVSGGCWNACQLNNMPDCR
ncbi:hypothetical protein Ptr902_10115 [Pyrenophora tritici-repentis]|uniref:Uncharacterized protein n=1 Tax=Pyrenophora tritici-repentis TaxID=45151 RepID=A0A5M9KU47_9PLEO|nr:hypothetical protein PtrV1_12443 [Pyrenophora tritici-repentis]KAF7445247.1 hypothetical protein A1F99_102330 [Pyrenophora tritici-repentis]KAF7565511.1 hypothetical protein PtrM4_049450 [Pyrenophora tritici-repentis]KAI0584662.1 hypothetical protein Alg215_02899 [Pyrenophora tritici-repentis]KAI0590054.1 hypothetical protein Alg130_02609 [Pyrenophora tritici-repentis]